MTQEQDQAAIIAQQHERIRELELELVQAKGKAVQLMAILQGKGFTVIHCEACGCLVGLKHADKIYTPDDELYGDRFKDVLCCSQDCLDAFLTHEEER